MVATSNLASWHRLLSLGRSGSRSSRASILHRLHRKSHCRCTYGCRGSAGLPPGSYPREQAEGCYQFTHVPACGDAMLGMFTLAAGAAES